MTTADDICPFQAINGWYYLLTEDTGRRKHLQAAVKKAHLREQTTNNSNIIPTVNQDIMWMDPYTVSEENICIPLKSLMHCYTYGLHV